MKEISYEEWFDLVQKVDTAHACATVSLILLIFGILGLLLYAIYSIVNK